MMKSGFTRRRILKAAGVASAVSALGMPAVLRGAVAQTAGLPQFGSIPANLMGKGEVRVVGFGGQGQAAQREAYFKPFEQLTGIKVIDIEGSDPNKLKAMVDTGNVEWDVMLSSRTTVLRLGDKYFEPINYSLVDVANIPEIFRHPMGLDVLGFAHVISYRTDVFKEGPKNFVDFWNLAKFPGARTLPSGVGSNIPPLVAALIADGVPFDKIYPIDVDRAFKSLDKIRSSVVKYWDTEAMPIQMLVDREVVMGVAANGRLAQLQRDKVPVETVWNGGTLTNNAWVIPKGSKNVENAQKFIAFSTLPISQARASILIPYGFVNTAAAPLIPANILAQLPTAPGTLEQLVPYDYLWWKDNKSSVEKRWTEWVLG
jgi:putative spermidine/putrescine transport system substrate-binding protein